MENEKIRVLAQRIQALESSNISLKIKEDTDLKAHIEKLKYRKMQLEFKQSKE